MGARANEGYCFDAGKKVYECILATQLTKQDYLLTFGASSEVLKN